MKNLSATEQYSDYSLFIAPSLNGHYQGYYETLVKDYDGEYELYVCKTPLIFFFKFLKIITVKKYPYRVVFLHGEKFWFISLILRFFNVKTVLFFYYLQNKQYSSLKQSLLFALFKILNKTGVSTISIESPTKFPQHLFSGILLDYVSQKICKSSENKKNIRVLGYIDRRKNLPLIIDSLSNMPQGKEPLSLEIIGKVDPDYLELLKKIVASKQSSKLSISLNNCLIDSETFLKKISSARLVIAYYSDHYGSSGVVLESINQCTPVIFKNTGALKATSSYLNGYCDLDGNQHINNLIVKVLTREQDFVIKKEKLFEFRNNRTKCRFAKNFWKIIQ